MIRRQFIGISDQDVIVCTLFSALSSSKLSFRQGIGTATTTAKFVIYTIVHGLYVSWQERRVCGESTIDSMIGESLFWVSSFETQPLRSFDYWHAIDTHRRGTAGLRPQTAEDEEL